MALRNNVLLCVYTLSGTVHQVETSQLTISSGKALNFDRVVFHRYKQRRQSHSLQLWLKPTSAPDCAPTVQSLPRRWGEHYAELHIQGAPEPPSQTQPPWHHQQPPQAGCRQPGVLRGRLSRKLYSNQLWKFSIFSLGHWSSQSASAKPDFPCNENKQRRCQIHVRNSNKRQK